MKSVIPDNNLIPMMSIEFDESMTGADRRVTFNPLFIAQGKLIPEQSSPSEKDTLEEISSQTEEIEEGNEPPLVEPISLPDADKTNEVHLEVVEVSGLSQVSKMFEKDTEIYHILNSYFDKGNMIPATVAIVPTVEDLDKLYEGKSLVKKLHNLIHETHYKVIACSYNNKLIQALQEYSETQQAYNIMKDGLIFSCNQVELIQFEGKENKKLIGHKFDSRFVSIFPLNVKDVREEDGNHIVTIKGKTLIPKCLGILTRTICREATSDPSLPYTNLAITDMPETINYTNNDINLLLNGGYSVGKFINGRFKILNLLTTRTTKNDVKYLNDRKVTKYLTFLALRQTLYSEHVARFHRYKLMPDGTEIKHGERVITPASYNGFLNQMYEYWVTKKWVVRIDPDELDGPLFNAEIDEEVPTKINSFIHHRIVEGWDQTSVRMYAI